MTLQFRNLRCLIISYEFLFIFLKCQRNAIPSPLITTQFDAVSFIKYLELLKTMLSAKQSFLDNQPLTKLAWGRWILQLKMHTKSQSEAKKTKHKSEFIPFCRSSSWKVCASYTSVKCPLPLFLSITSLLWQKIFNKVSIWQYCIGTSKL